MANVTAFPRGHEQPDFAVIEKDLVVVCGAFALASACVAFVQWWCALTHASQRVVSGLRVCALAMTWYSISVGFTLFNKFILKYWMGTGFPYPLAITATHMLLKWAFTVLAVLAKAQCQWSRRQRLGWKAWLTLGVPIGAATSLDILLSNVALIFTTVTLTTIVKSLAIVFNFVLSVVLGLEQLRARLCLVVALITCGVALSSYGDLDFNTVGFMCALGAAVLAAVRWVVTQRLLWTHHAAQRLAVTPTPHATPIPRHARHESDSLLVLYALAPAAAVVLVPAFLLVELRPLLADPVWHNGVEAAELGLIVVGGGALAFALLFVEVNLVKHTSALSLNVLGNVKDVLKIVLAVGIFHDHLSAVNVAGVALTLASACLYSHFKTQDGAKDSDAEGPYTPVQREEGGSGGGGDCQESSSSSLNSSGRARAANERQRPLPFDDSEFGLSEDGSRLGWSTENALATPREHRSTKSGSPSTNSRRVPQVRIKSACSLPLAPSQGKPTPRQVELTSTARKVEQGAGFVKGVV